MPFGSQNGPHSFADFPGCMVRPSDPPVSAFGRLMRFFVFGLAGGDPYLVLLSFDDKRAETNISALNGSRPDIETEQG